MLNNAYTPPAKARHIEVVIAHEDDHLSLTMPEVEERIHPDFEQIRDSSRAFEKRFDLQPRDHSADYAYLCARMHPDLCLERVQIASDVVANWFHHDDGVDGSLTVNATLGAREDGRSPSLEDRELLRNFVRCLGEKNLRMLDIFTGETMRAPHTDSGFFASCRELASRIAALEPTPGQRGFWLRTLAAYYRAVAEAKEVEVMRLSTYLKLREDTGAAPALIALGLLLESIDEDFNDPLNVRLVQRAGLLTSLHNDFFSLQPDLADGQRENIVLVCGDPRKAQKLTNLLMSEYLESPSSPGVRRMCDAMIVANVWWSIGTHICPPATRYR